MSQDIGTFIGMRGLHGFAAAAASVVINAPDARYVHQR